MSSFLRDILIEEKNKTNLNQDVEVIKKEIIKLKSIINERMKDEYVKFEANLKPDEILVNKSEKLIDDMQILQNQVHDQVKIKLLSSSKELQNLSLQLKEYNYSLNLSNYLLEIYKCFESVKNYKSYENDQYTITAITLVKLHNYLIEKDSDVQQLNIYESLKEEYYRLHDNFIEELTAVWDEKIRWYSEQETFHVKLFNLEIQMNSNELKDVIQALHNIDRLTKCIDHFSTKLLQNFIKPIINYNCLIQRSDKILSMKILNQQISIITTILNLDMLFQFLFDHFNFIIQNEEYFLERLSKFLLPEFSTILFKGCISEIIPTTTSELEFYRPIAKEFESFHNYLIQIKFISKDDKFLSKYTYNVDELYMDKKCEKLLEIARNLMKTDLHVSFRYETKNIEEFIDNKENCNIINRKLSQYTFHLPECQISYNAQELLYLVEKTLKEACNSSDKYQVLRLFYISRNIFEMYAVLIPEIHKSYLETIPQHVALFHNNCIYLAHNLLTLSNKYKLKMPIFAQDFSMIYVDQIILLRQVASDYFLNHMKYQRDIIFDILRESGLSAIGQMPELPTTTEQALRQCIRRLELLKKAWREILPIKLYCRTLGCIVNDMVDDLCSKIVNVEDIPANVASELVTLFNVVVKRIPQIFPNPLLIEQHVHKWRKLKELIIILGASLKEIEDRWADGKGPLANEFSSQHVKQLIRALFQNTDRRSNVLSRIKEKL